MNTPDLLTRTDLPELMQSLTPSESAELDRLIQSRPLPLWQPNPKNLPQCRAFESTADVIGYGGAAGGGKTDVALGMAIEKHRRTLFMRREYAQLIDVIDRSREIIGLKGRYNGSTHTWRDLPGKRVIEFGGCANSGDEEIWRGRPHDLNIFDEATFFLERQVRFIMGWNRSTDPEIKCQTLITFNPPSNSDGEWVKKFFAPWLDKSHPNPALPGELRWFTMGPNNKEIECDGNAEFINDAGETIRPKSRTFFPAKLTDNPYWEGTDYAATIQGMPEPARSQMLYGDMDIGAKDDAYQVIPSEWIRAAQKRWIAKDEPGKLDCIGVDPSRGGDDSTVVTPRYGCYFGEQIQYPGSSIRTGGDVVVRIVPLLANGGTANIDVIGIGSSAVDIARMQGIPVNAINFSEGTDEKDAGGILGFMNVRALAYWRMRESLDPTGKDEADLVAIPDDPELFTELIAHRYEPGMRGIKVKSKDEVKERIGRSPDKADSLVLANLITGYNCDVASLIEFYRGNK